ncbi:restriction endonuclease [Tautonia sociabilis]|uniref:Restriction endonuclease n=1 Tax=Tautonia sociabilis TaxID=2080755 RepID=A0A432MHR8_9BACT|nr:restriction endonuclease [Tautonia sociabilis]RUL86469.1 restriction endonuclease [Tautonia sociabilis]
MECLGPKCAELLLQWLRDRAAEGSGGPSPGGEGDRDRGRTVQGMLWSSVPYNDEAPAIRSEAELEGAFEHLEYAVFRRFENQLTRAERARLDNTIRNVLYKIERYAARLPGPEGPEVERRRRLIQEAVAEAREKAERLRLQARRADLKLAQLDSLSPEGFEEFVAELFEAIGYEVDRVGGTGDEGADLRVTRNGLRGVVQCKYHKKGVVGSPELQKFLGTIHHTGCHKGFFVTTRTFSLAAERFASDHPIELVDGPRLVELVREAMGPGATKEPEPAWF